MWYNTIRLSVDYKRTHIDVSNRPIIYHRRDNGKRKENISNSGVTIEG